MSDALVTRTVHTDLAIDELWALVADGAAWSDWMVDASDVEVTPGSLGTVTDAGADRTVRIEQAADGRVQFTWWPVGDERLTSAVELVVLPAPHGSALRITERFTACASIDGVDLVSTGIAWDVRTLLLVLATASRLSVTA